MKKLTILSILFCTTSSFAQSEIPTPKMVHKQIKEMKVHYQNIKSDVAAGKLTKSDAQKIWNQKIIALKALKSRAFENKISTLDSRFRALTKKHPEKAKSLEALWKKHKKNRSEKMMNRKNIRNKVRNGEMTMEEALISFTEKPKITKKTDEKQKQGISLSSPSSEGAKKTQKELKNGSLTAADTTNIKKEINNKFSHLPSDLPPLPKEVKEVLLKVQQGKLTIDQAKFELDILRKKLQP